MHSLLIFVFFASYAPVAMGTGAGSGTILIGFAGLLLLLLGSTPICSGAWEDPLVRLPTSRREGGPKRRVVFNVDDFGAAGDGLVNDTKAFEDAWDVVCSSSSKAVLEFSAGKRYLMWPVSKKGPCKSKVTLRISGTIVAPGDPAAWDGYDPSKWLHFIGIKHMAMNGGGMIDGVGEKWWAQSCKRNKSIPCHHAPTAIMFHKCNHLTVENLDIVDSQQTHISFHRCSRVKASGLKVLGPADSPNTDGIHISASTSVIVRDSTIKTGDDCISIVSHSSKVKIRNVICGPGHGISIGSLGKKNRWAEVHDVVVEGAVLTNTTNGLRIKTWQGGRGFVHGITYRNILMRSVSNPIIIDQYYCDRESRCANQTDAVKVSGISYIDIRGTSSTDEAIKFLCSDSHSCEDIFLEGIQLSLVSGEQATAFCWKAMGFSYGTVVPPSCLPEKGLCSIKQKVDADAKVTSS